MRRFSSWVVVCLITIVTAAACAPLLRGYNGPGVRLFIANDSWDPVDIFVVRNGVEDSIGRVWKYDYKNFELSPVDEDDRAEIIVRAVSEVDGTFMTDTIRAARGTVIGMQLEWPWDRSRWWHF